MVRASSDRESDHRRKSSAKKLLHAHEFCSITGVSNETLRHYVDKGIILPAAIAPNNYKMYSERNVIDMLLARSCRGLDLSIGAILEKVISVSNLVLEERGRITLERFCFTAQPALSYAMA